MKFLAYFALPLFLLFLVSCSTIYRSDTWPAELPPKQYYLDYYKQDTENQKAVSVENYLMWIKRFYLGWELYGRGWLQITDEVSQTLEKAEDKLIAKQKIIAMGKLVSAEWAKNKNHRVINTRHLGLWGNAMNESIMRSEQIFMLNKISEDINKLLDKKISPEQITDNRYYPVEIFGADF